MKKINREAFRFLFKLSILIQLYSYQKSKTEATQISHIKENVGQSDQTDGKNLNDRMSQLEAKGRRHENDISFLKAIIVEDKRTIRQLRGRVSSLESFMLTKNLEPNDQLLLRQKRPYRLLPVHPDGDKMEKEKAAVDTRFYGPASNCNELGKLGFTLNGYYLVKPKDESMSNDIEVVLCQFNQPGESKGGTNEERLGLITITSKNMEKSKAHSEEKKIELFSVQPKTNKNQLKAKKKKLHGLISSIDSTTTTKPAAHSKENPMELVSTQPKTKKNKIKVTKKNIRGFISSIDNTTTAKPSAHSKENPMELVSTQPKTKKNKLKGLSTSHGIPIDTPRRANLINGFGKCVGEDALRPDMYQWDCDSSNIKMLWSWNQVSLGSGDRHLCHGGGFCAASNANFDGSIHLLVYYHLNEQGQRFSFVDSTTHPGFYVIKNDYGKCLSVEGNTNKTKAPVWVHDCNPSEAGQRWKWHY